LSFSFLSFLLSIRNRLSFSFRKKTAWLLSRVTRLGEFLPDVGLFTLGLKMTEVAHISGLLFPMVPVMYSF
jgi:hypothetical protein